jgi:Transcriptional regulator PadR-like family
MREGMAWRVVSVFWLTVAPFVAGYFASKLLGPRGAFAFGVIVLVVVLLVRHSLRGSTETRERVLRVFLEHPDQRLYGLEIARRIRAKGGSLYPALARLEQDGWLLSDWEDAGPDAPRRRIYWLNPDRPTQEMADA